MKLKATLFTFLAILILWMPMSVRGHVTDWPAQKISLLDAIDHISKEYEVYFTFDMTLVSDVRVDYAQESYNTAEGAIAGILKGTALNYKFYDLRFVIIYQEDAEGLKSLKEMSRHLGGLISEREASVKTASERNIRIVPSLESRMLKKELVPVAFNIDGMVVDQEGEPLIGVNIQVKGSNQGTSTDFDGRFTLRDIDENAILVVSYIGYQTQEVSVAGKSNISVTLTSDSQLLDEVVVVGYGTQKKVNLSGAVSNVGSEVLKSRPLATLGEGLQGTVSNLNITPGSGAPGQGTSFNIRGFTSLSGGSPLVLVNGVSMDINMINPQDVESITVLKDGASAAIYGARAAFGVILITTKQGKLNEKPTISVNSNYSINSPTRLINWFDSKNIVEWMDEAYLRTTGKPYYDDITRDAILAHYNDPSQPSSIIHPNNPNEFTNVANVDWNEVLLDDSYPMQNHSISMTGGTEKLSYYSSFSYLNQKGLVSKDLFDEQYSRYNVLTDLTYKANNWITVGTRIGANLSNKDFPINDSWFRNSFPEGALPYQQHTYATRALKDPNGNWTHEGSIQNLAQMVSEGGHQKRNIADLWLTGKVNLTPFKGMTVNMDYTYNLNSLRHLQYAAHVPFYDVNGNVNAFYGGSNPNRIIRENDNAQYNALNIYSDYTKSFMDSHNFKIMVGYNQEYTNLLTAYTERRNLIVNEIPYIALASGDRFVDDSESEFSIRGVFGRFNYDYKNKYFVEVNGRYDGSSKFPGDNRFAFFPSGSVAWRIDQEGFFNNNVGLFDLLKFRFSYGALGNQNIAGNYPYIGTMGTSQAGYLINGDVPVQVTAPGLVSSNLTWETVIQSDLGVDFSVLDYRLNGSFDVYRRDTKNMLTKGKTLPAVIAVNEPLENAADLKTIGWDLNVGWQDHVGDFSYGASLILSTYKAEITKFDNPNQLINDYYVGKDIGEIWGLVTGGLFQTDEEASAYQGNKITGRIRQAGDLWHEDLNGDGEISYGNSTLDDPGDRKVIGNSTPKYSFGIRGNSEWKGFDLTFFFQGVGKRDLWMSSKYFLTTYSYTWGPRPDIMLDYWSPDNRDAAYPRPIRTNTQDISTTQTRFLQNAAYIRLKQLTIGYQIPVEITQKAKIDNLRIYFSGSNLWTGTKMVSIADPELNGPSAYPLYKSFSLGVNISL